MTGVDQCGHCGRSRPLELQMTTKGGSTLSMRSCPRCETRSWFADGEPVTKDDVLRVTADDPDFELVATAGRPKRSPGRR